MLLFLSQPWNQFTSYLLLYPVEPPSSASPTNLTTLSFTSTGYYVSGGTTKDGSPSNVCNLCSSGNIATGGKYISLGSRGKRYEGSCTRLMYSDQNSNAQFGGNGDLNYGGGGGGGSVLSGGAGGSSFWLKSVCLTYTYSVSDLPLVILAKYVPIT